VIGRLVKISSSDNKLILALRTSKGKVKVYVNDYYPYFYAVDSDGQYRAVDGTKLRKIVVGTPSDVPKIRTQYVHYEADIPYIRRFLIDTGVRSYLSVPSLTVSWLDIRPVNNPQEQIPLRIWFVDIEVASNVLPNPLNPEQPIHSITIYDTYIGKYITLVVSGKTMVDRSDEWIRVHYPSETEMLRSLSDLVNMFDPDVFVAWNADFDYTYLVNRYLRLGMKSPFDLDVFDLLSGYKELYKRKSYRLKSVAFEEGLITEEEAKMSYSPDMPVEQLMEYNKRDVEIMVKLDMKYRLLDFYIALKEFVGLPSLSDISSSVLIDTELLRLARERGVVLPSKREVEGEPYEGAVVLEPPAGIYENVAVFDMTTYYPSIIISFNISPDTLSPDGEIRYGDVAFRKSPTGLLPELCKRFLSLRKSIEDEMTKYDQASPEYQQLKTKRDAVKYLVNAIYGYTAFERSRIFDVRLASTITAIGREGLLKTKELASAKGYNVLYGDTDSIMIQVPYDDAEELMHYLNREITAYFKEKYGLPNVQIGLKFEVYADRVMFFGVKKRYVAHIVWEKGKHVNYFKYVGIEAVRSDQSSFSQEFQKRLIELAIMGASKEEIMDFINSAREEMRRRPLIEIAPSEGIQKPLDKYKNRPPHIRAALYSNTYLGTNFKHGDRVYYLWVKAVKGYPPTDVVAFDVDTRLPELVVDWEKMEEVNIWQKAEPILQVLKISMTRAVGADLRRWVR